MMLRTALRTGGGAMRKILNVVVLAVLLPALLIATVLLTYLHFFAPGDKNLSGKWTASLDMTDHAI